MAPELFALTRDKEDLEKRTYRYSNLGVTGNVPFGTERISLWLRSLKGNVLYEMKTKIKLKRVLDLKGNR